MWPDGVIALLVSVGVVFKYVFVQLQREFFSYSATSFSKLGQERPSLGPCLSLGTENMPLGMSAWLVNGQPFFQQESSGVIFWGEKNAKVWNHDLVARVEYCRISFWPC